MPEIEFRLPSKVPYAYVNLKFQVDEQPTPEILAAMYASYVMAFAGAERAALDAYRKPPGAPVAPSATSLAEVFVDTKDEVLAATQGVDSADSDDVQSAAVALLGGMGATVIAETKEEPAPWEKEASAPQPKPWEKKKQASSDTVATKAAAVIEW